MLSLVNPTRALQSSPKDHFTHRLGHQSLSFFNNGEVDTFPLVKKNQWFIVFSTNKTFGKPGKQSCYHWHLLHQPHRKSHDVYADDCINSSQVSTFNHYIQVTSVKFDEIGHLASL